MLRSHPWWVLHGAGPCLLSIRIGLYHCCTTGLVSRSCGSAYSSRIVLLRLAARHSLHLMHGVVLVCCCVIWLIDLCMCVLMPGHGSSLLEGDSLTRSWLVRCMVPCIPWQICTILVRTDSCYPLRHHCWQLLYLVCGTIAIGSFTVSYDASPTNYDTWVMVSHLVDVTLQADVAFSDMYK